eukprot:g23987.t1
MKHLRTIFINAKPYLRSYLVQRHSLMGLPLTLKMTDPLRSSMFQSESARAQNTSNMGSRTGVRRDASQTPYKPDESYHRSSVPQSQSPAQPNQHGEQDDWTVLHPGYVVNLNERLMLAAERGNMEEALKLIEAGAEPSWADPEDHKRTSLMHAARCGHADIAVALVEKRARINAQDQSGWTALHCAAYYGQPELVKVLLERGADYRIKHKGGMTAQDTAEWNGKHACSRLMLKPEKLVTEYKAQLAKEKAEKAAREAEKQREQLFKPVKVPAALKIKQLRPYKPPTESETKMARDEVELMDPEQWSAASVSFWLRTSFRDQFEPAVLEAYIAGIREQDVDGPALLNPEIFNEEFLEKDICIQLKAHRYKILTEAKKLREHEDEDLTAFFAKIGLLGKGLEELCEAEGIDEPAYFADFSEDQLVEAGFKRAHAKRILRLVFSMASHVSCKTMFSSTFDISSVNTSGPGPDPFDFGLSFFLWSLAALRQACSKFLLL